MSLALVSAFLVGCGSSGGGSLSEGNKTDDNKTPVYDPSSENYSGKTYTNSIGAEFIRVPAGTFQMGADPVNDALAFIGSYDNEKPHNVTITKAYYFGKYVVSSREWANITGENLLGELSTINRFSASKVSLAQIQNFITQLNVRELRGAADRPKYRLPTEAEWEYAARLDANGIPTTTAWSFGNDLADLSTYAVYNETGTSVSTSGRKSPTGLGFYDIYGYLQEYTSDLYDEKYGLSDAQLAGITTDPTGPTSSTDGTILRGGSRTSTALTPDGTEPGWAETRSAYRFVISDTKGYSDVGFRLVLEIPDSAQ
jgi:formylglycine-generating enzyme required for sulfatase activity